MRLAELCLKDGLMVLAPPVPGIVFTSRRAGNLRSGNPEATANRRVLSEALGIPSRWATAHQVHGRAVLCAGEGTWLPAGLPAGPPAGPPDADAVVVREPNQPVAVLVADCVPVALAGVRVAAAVHAGWRGLCAGVIEAAVGAVDTPRLTAWIGPSIGPCCFEVGPEVPARFAAGHPGAPDCSVLIDGALHFDLRRASAAVLESCGVEVAGGVDVPCTRCDARFFSHRRDGTPDRQALVTWVGGDP